jgi:hypothetical protein
MSNVRSFTSNKLVSNKIIKMETPCDEPWYYLEGAMARVHHSLALGKYQMYYLCKRCRMFHITDKALPEWKKDKPIM